MVLSVVKPVYHYVQVTLSLVLLLYKRYNVVSPNQSMTCATANVIIYLVTCKRCGIQYVGETGQTLRKTLNNHRNRLKQLSNLYVYQHFTSDGHSENDISIMPIEEVTSSGN